MPRMTEWISERTKTGLRELPTNAAWLAKRASHPGRLADSATEGPRDKARQVGASLLDAAPVGDSVEMRMKRARAAAERAAEADEQVKREQTAARQEADEEIEEAKSVATEATEAAKSEAEEAEEHAKELLAD